MIGILIFCILALIGFCMMAGEDMIHKTDHTISAWAVVIFMLCATIGTVFALSDSVKTQAIVDYEQGKYYLEKEIYSDTTYFIKRCEK